MSLFVSETYLANMHLYLYGITFWRAEGSFGSAPFLTLTPENGPRLLLW